MNKDKIISFFKKKTTIKAILIILYYFLVMFILSTYILEPLFIKLCEHISGVGQQSWSLSSKCNMAAIYNILIYAILFIPIFIFYRYELVHDYSELKGSSKLKNFIWIALLAFYITSVLSSVISNMIYNDSTSSNQSTIEAIVKNNALCFIIMIIQACIIGPIVEEIVFRQAIFDVCNNKYLSIAISSILFSVIHITSSTGSLRYMISILIPYLASGLCFSIIYEKGHRNVWPNILVHMLTNFLSILSIWILL